MSVLEKMGVKERSFFWTMGRYDAIFIGDAPDEDTATVAALAVASQGNIRTETFRATLLMRWTRSSPSCPSGLT